jgi:hypothetical protein
MGQRFIVVNNEDDAVFCYRAAAYLATSMSTVNDLGSDLETDLAFISDTCPISAVLVKNNVSPLTIDDRAGGLLPDYKPLFQISFSAVQVGLIFRL